ncbi:hypothetical protein L1049_023232 [Liquidambar formosana]|uniref:Terpene synthase metal-binding domain-containing protein n=1 Tax=Liquidambar formosana TaxID=63359 RepID=A0AAP0RFD6_LIQFO
MDPYVTMQVSHALEVPLHWRMNPVLLEFAKLDYNMVWWRSTALGEKLSFARDKVVECFLWTAGITFEPQYGYCRRNLAKVNALIIEIDDVYDVYGTLDELELFTDAVGRWEINAMEHLPDYLKILFLALYNSVIETRYLHSSPIKKRGRFFFPFPPIRIHFLSYDICFQWAELCKAYFTEAKWYHSGYVPTLEEYFDTAWLSIAAPLMLLNVYFTMKKPITKEALECLLDRSDTTEIRCAAMILRLADDLGTSSDELSRGDVPKSIQCYMHETGASEEDAHQYVRNLIGETWKEMNGDRLADFPFSQSFFRSALNLGRMVQCMYQHGDAWAWCDEGWHIVIVC